MENSSDGPATGAEALGGRVLTRRRTLAGVLGGMLVVAGSASGCRNAEGDADGDLGSGAGSGDDGATPGTGQPTIEPPVTSAPAATALPAAPPTNRDPDVHLLRRLTYGPTGSSLDHLRSVGVEAWLDEQLAPADIDTTEVDDALAAAAPQLDLAAGDLLAAYRADGNGAQLAGVLTIAALLRHTRSPAQLHERLVEFWGDHFNVPQTSPSSTIARIVMDRDVFRRHALGRFDDLLIATAQSPAMLLYLDNFRSSVGSINENYAREVLELHTVGVNGGYDEADITSVAALLTGWSVTRELEFRFVPRNHDPTAQTILGWERPTTGDPRSHGEDFLRHLARLPQTARYVSHELAVRFAADDPDPALVEAMADAWIEHDTEIVPVVRTMIEHPAFRAAPAKFNRPWDYLVQTLRSLDATFDVDFPLDVRRAYGAIRDLGQVPFRWPSPDGYADTGTAWLDAGGVLARWNFAASVTLGDETFRTGLSDRLAELRGSTAAVIHERLTEWLRLGAPTDEDRALFADLTGWAPDDVPDDDDLDDAGRLVAFVLVAGPTAQTR